MAALSMNQYLWDFLQNNSASSNELKLDPKDKEFNFYTIYLEGLPHEQVDYVTDTATLVFVLDGEGEVRFSHNSLNLTQGNIVFIEKNSQYSISSPSRSLIIKFKMKPGFKWGDSLDKNYQSREEEKTALRFEQGLVNEGYCFFKTTSVMKSSQYLSQLLEEYLNGSLFGNLAAQHYISLILITALRTQLINTSLIADNGGFGKFSLEEYIDNHYNDINLTDTAAHFGFNKNYFSSLVKEKTGKSFVEHVDQRRMKEAKRLLALPNISLEEIIQRVGFSSKSFFYKKFNRYYGMTPLAMRQQLFKEANINLK